MARLSKSDRRCVAFAAACENYRLDPMELADLCALVRRAFSAGERECNEPNFFADHSRRLVEVRAKSMGLATSWPGLAPEFRAGGGPGVKSPGTIRIPWDEA